MTMHEHDLHALVTQEVEAALDQLRGCDMWGTERRPDVGISTVLTYSDAMHVLLHLRARLAAALAARPAEEPMPASFRDDIPAGESESAYLSRKAREADELISTGRLKTRIEGRDPGGPLATESKSDRRCALCDQPIHDDGDIRCNDCLDVAKWEIEATARRCVALEQNVAAAENRIASLCEAHEDAFGRCVALEQERDAWRTNADENGWKLAGAETQLAAQATRIEELEAQLTAANDSFANSSLAELEEADRLRQQLAALTKHVVALREALKQLKQVKGSDAVSAAFTVAEKADQLCEAVK